MAEPPLGQGRMTTLQRIVPIAAPDPSRLAATGDEGFEFGDTDAQVLCERRGHEDGMARRGRKLTIEWAAEDDAAGLYGRYRRERRPDVRPRLHGLWLVRTGEATREASEVLGVDERTVQRWLAWYRAGGPARLEGRQAGSHGAPSFLTPERKAELADEVATGRFRTAAEIRAWVRERWGVRYTEGGMYALLGRLRCAPKVPRPIHENADRLAQARWKKAGSRPASTRSS